METGPTRRLLGRRGLQDRKRSDVSECDAGKKGEESRGEEDEGGC